MKERQVTDQVEEMVVGLYDIGEIIFVSPPGPEVEVADPDYPEEVFKKLKSERMSPHYINGRNVTSLSTKRYASLDQQLRTRNLVIKELGNLIEESDIAFQHLLGLPEAMTPISSMLAGSLGLSLLWERVNAAKKYGVHELIQGVFNDGDGVLVQDNVITDSKTKKEVLPVLEANGLHAVRFDVLIDREEGGREELSSIGYDLRSVVGMGAVVRILAENKRISPQQQHWSEIYRERTLASLEDVSTESN